jgi:CheY-like chemotaxis protein
MSHDEADALAMPLILFVEDEALIREIVVDALEEAGFSTLVASDGKAAMALLKEWSDEVRGLVTDINLDDGMSGWQLASAARERSADLPIVYVSGASGHEWGFTRCAQQPDDH